MRRCNRIPTDQGEVLDNGCYVSFIQMVSTPKVILLENIKYYNNKYKLYSKIKYF